MRIALVVQKLAGLRGGTERVTVDLARRLAERGHEVTIVTYEPSLVAPGYDVGDVQVVNLFPSLIRRLLGLARRVDSVDAIETATGRRGNGVVLSRAKWELTHGWFARRLARWLKRHPQEAVVGFLPPAISAVALAGERLGDRRPRIVASTHSVPDLDFGPDGRWDPNPVTRRTNLRALELVDAVTVLQPEFVDQLPEEVRDRAVVVPNIVESPGEASGRHTEPLILGVGSLNDVKRYDLLVEAFARVVDRLPGWKVIVHGEGPERTALESRTRALGLQDRVRFPGVTDAIAPVYDSARIMCHPAAYEGFGLSVAEAILHGVPVVASVHSGAIGRLVEDRVTGLLVDDTTDPVAAFADALAQLATTPLDESEHARAARSLAERLAPGPIIATWEQILSR